MTESSEATEFTELPEADRIEQEMPAEDEPADDEVTSVPLEVEPADALEQSRVVPGDEDYPRE
ncbi:hypothetical protein [Rhodococcus sp. A5(2022)]|uniref:hypothetical protein n=1 Tax=Rhodococcus sp. A5(2022) TaxID=3003588 RepID=UPI0022A822AC|nr:hypothetical protein [Rhodococcus sp. A5(2022)]MCZ1071728.1 hypothetical protein [Rhodococcus sp. A5(2022)]